MMLRALFLWIVLSTGLAADPLRVAVYNTELDRDGPGLLLRDILKGAEDVTAVAQVIAAADADVILLLRVDYDLDLVALSALNDVLGPTAAYPHLFALRPNTGWATGLDIDGDGRLGEPDDAQSFGRFSGSNGMAILSRLPIDRGGVRDLSGLLWRDMPAARLPVTGGDPFWGAEILEVLRLSTVGHWDVPVSLPTGGRLHLLAWHGSPPVFDGPEDRNGLRGADEARLWQLYLDGAFGPAPEGPVVVLGTSNIDPVRGEGRQNAMRALLADPRLQDPRPESPGGREAGVPVATVDWRGAVVPGLMRVDYLLPDARLRVAASGILWPATDPDAGAPPQASRHRLIWVDLDVPDG